MRRPSPASLHDRQQSLITAREHAEAEMHRLAREEEYLIHQVRLALEQVHYYEGLLAVLRRDWGKPGGLADLVRRLG